MELPEAGGEAYISIHAPREGSDSGSWPARRSQTDFNPRSP